MFCTKNSLIQIAILLVLAPIAQLFAQTDSTATPKLWKKGGLVNLQGSQVTLSNWAAGGQNAISGNGLISLFANYSKNKSSFNNTFIVAYGLTQQGDNAFIKNDDRLELTSDYQHKIDDKWSYAAGLVFRSQMAPGYKFPQTDSVLLSDLFAPAFTIVSVGIDHKPKKWLSLSYKPLAGKLTIVNNQTLANQGAFGVDAATYDTTGKLLTEGKKVRYEFGGFINLRFKKELFKNVELTSNLDLFSNYLENPQNVDINFENILNLKVNDFLSANIIFHLVYDDDVKTPSDKDGDGVNETLRPELQIRQVLGVGFNYKF